MAEISEIKRVTRGKGRIYVKGQELKLGGATHKIERFTKGGNMLLRGPDGILRMEKLPDDRLNVRVTIEITGNLRRADLDRFTQAMGKTAAFEFENGGGGT